MASTRVGRSMGDHTNSRALAISPTTTTTPTGGTTTTTAAQSGQTTTTTSATQSGQVTTTTTASQSGQLTTTTVASLTSASSSDLAFTGPGPLLWITGLLGMFFVLIGGSLLLMVDAPRRVLHASVRRVVRGPDRTQGSA